MAKLRALFMSSSRPKRLLTSMRCPAWTHGTRHGAAVIRVSNERVKKIVRAQL
jgi:hypothetical protein